MAPAKQPHPDDERWRIELDGQFARIYAGLRAELERLSERLARRSRQRNRRSRKARPRKRRY